MSDALLIAVDGGNSKTDVVLLDCDGGVVAAVRGAGSNHHSTGREGALNIIEALINAAWRDAPDRRHRPRPSMAAGAFFLAGADAADEMLELHTAIAARGWARRVEVGNDTVALLRAGSASGYGAAVVVGAGVNGIGDAPSGTRAQFGALGDVTGDWGGGLGIGMAALGAAVRGEDGRDPPTALSARIAAHFGEPSALDVGIAVHRGRIAGDRLGELAPLVFDLSRDGDAAAVAIVDRQADEVVSFAVAALRRSGQAGGDVEVVLGGSVLAAAPERLIERVSAGIAAAAPRARLVRWNGPPVVGAALAVLDAAGSGAAARARLRAELTEDRIRRIDDGDSEAVR